jgi:hypothetical protein
MTGRRPDARSDAHLDFLNDRSTVVAIPMDISFFQPVEGPAWR